MDFEKVEKVRKALEFCVSEPCNDCPYLHERNCTLAMVTDALELVDELEERIAIMEENRRWISTDDRMPVVGKPVFGAVYGSDIVIMNEGETVIDALRRTKDDNQHTVTCVWYGQSEGWWSDDGLMIVEPRYWMPIDIPVPPDPEDMQ